ncbi:hypothetical protein CSUNSWCD_245 [Campylobacter showae CSUNSWCD]|uniref:Uncharacterized protein n=1 Tax=Campylobacter showae CSUNSWCD TaxID=1244083 RepID=M5IM09_9BACT|nr:hypothetical protein CSUNSWCD_245 [Campylobacter showae CSUNSWCD]
MEFFRYAKAWSRFQRSKMLANQKRKNQQTSHDKLANARKAKYR